MHHHEPEYHMKRLFYFLQAQLKHAAFFWGRVVVVVFFLFFSCCCPIICANLRGTAPVPLFLASLPPISSKTHSASWPHLRSTGGDIRSLVGCHTKVTLYCCQVTVVIQYMQDTLLTTKLTKSQSQSEWAFPQESKRHHVPPPILLYGLSDIEGLWSELPRVWKEAGTDCGHHKSMAWRATDAETILFYAGIDEDRDDNWWCYGGPFGSETTLGGGDSSFVLVECQTCDWKVAGSSSSRSGGQISSSWSTFCADSYFSICSTSVLPLV